MKKFSKEDSKALLYLGGGAVLIYYLGDFIKSWVAKLKPTPNDGRQDDQKEVITRKDKGIINVTPKGNGANTKRLQTDVYLTSLADKFYGSIDGIFVEHVALQNSLIPIQTDADFARMSEIYGIRGADGFGFLGRRNLLEAINEYANAYDKARINQSWANNKKYPNKITFKL